ncbi:copper-binding protein [Lichenibacterium minor]|uniref:Copper-binding protein n=1 Tax=Lichenibacterium minor TaxID=2316528 RepID=A0A4Q2U8W2_9HYPH|nr:copper-binding protein [Lichenibacterium minor]RYC31335.1 copper-binding protein [Lichenibacterium minor]
MRREVFAAALLAFAAPALFEPSRSALAQAARGAPAAFARVRDVMVGRFRDEPLVGDPDRDFAALLAAVDEELVFLSKTQLEYGGDRHLREVAQRVGDDARRSINDLRDWQVRSREASYRAQPDQPPPGSGPLDRQSAADLTRPAAAPSAPPAVAAGVPATPPAAAAPPSSAPLVAGTVKKVDAASGKVTLDHARIPNIDMDAMTMAYRLRDPAALAGLKAGDRVRFSAEAVDGQTLITRIQPAR